MGIEKLYQTIEASAKLSPDYKTALLREVNAISLPKSHFLVEPPRVVEFAYFIETGFAMSFRYSEGRKMISNFWQAGSFIFHGKNFFDRLPAADFVQLMVPSQLLCFSLDSILRLFDTFPEAHFLHRVFTNNHIEQLRERVHDVQHLTTLQRYEKLRYQYPGIEQLVTQEHIASYLGVTPQSMSRLKRKLT